MIYVVAYTFVTCNCIIVTWSIWVYETQSIVSWMVAIIIALIMGICLFIWPLFIALGRGVFTSRWTKAGQKSIWEMSSITTIYFKKNWWLFLLYAFLAGGIICLIYIVGDLLVFGSSMIGQRAIMGLRGTLIFISTIGITMLSRHVIYIKERYKVRFSKYV
jgi:hypothetical protein